LVRQVIYLPRQINFLCGSDYIDINNLMNKKTSTFLLFLIAATITITAQSIITTGLKYLMIDFQISSSTAQLTYSIFLIILAVMIPPTAYISNRFKLKSILITSLTLFTIGSLIVYISPNIEMVLIGRILEAAGTGIIMPMTQIVLFKVIPEEKWSLVMGLFGLIIGIVPAMGPTIGGYIIDISSWRSIFLIFTILGIIVLILSIILVKLDLDRKPHPLDIQSLILSIIICLGIMIGFSNISDYGYDLIYVILPIILGIVSLIIFTKRQLKIDNPLINLMVLKSKYFVSGTVFVSLLYFTMCAINVLMPLFVQNIVNYSATTAGIVLLPGAIILILFNFIGSVLSDKIGIRKVLIASCILSIIGFMTMTTYTIDTSVDYMIITQIIRCLGAGLGFTPATTWTMSIVASDVEDATAINNTLRQIFGAIGSAISVVILSIFAGGKIGHTTASVNSFAMTSIIMAIIILFTLILTILYIKDKKQLISEEHAPTK